MKRVRRWPEVFTALLSLSLLLAMPSVAQTFRGSINGTITDPSGAVVPGAKVTATDVATGVVRDTVSSGAGEFLFNDLPQDSYTVKAGAAGFQSTEVTGVQVLAGKIYTLAVKLNVAQQASTVEVSADTLSLDTTTVTQVTTLDSESLQDVPLNGRDFTQLLGSSASFAGYNNSGSVNGTRSNQINYTINGTDNNDLYLNVDAVNQGGISGIAGVVYPIDALDEYSLQTTGNSESGRSPGGNLNVTTKSGSNQLHGDAYYYNRNEALAVLSPFVTPGSPEQPLRNQNYGAFRRRAHLARPYLLLPHSMRSRSSSSESPIPSPSPRRPTRPWRSRSWPNTTSSPARFRRISSARCGIRAPSPTFRLLPATTPAARRRPATVTTPSTHLDHNFSEKSHLSAIWYFGQGYADAPSCVFVCSYLPEYFQTVPYAHPELQHGLELQPPPQPVQPACRRRQLLHAGLCRSEPQPESPHPGRPEHRRLTLRLSADRHQRLRLHRRHANLGPQRHLRPDCGHALLDGGQAPVALWS